MNRTCCFDFGNTRLKCALFVNRDLQELRILDKEDPETLNALMEEFKPNKSILASVINHQSETETILKANTQFHKLNANSKIPFSTPVGKPETIGADRLAVVAAAVDLFPNQHNLVISLGTCITYNFVNNRHEFLGGSISPGMQMRFRSMHEYTALLPMVEADSQFPLIGYDTKTNLLSGVILGMSKEIDGIIDAYNTKFSKFNVLLTGGDMPFFEPNLKNKIFADPDLIYKGLFAISEANNQ